MMLAMLEFPAWLKPEIIPGLPFRWYGLMYVIAFGVTWYLFQIESKRIKAPWTEDLAANFFLWAIVGVLLGGRLAGTLIYEPTDHYWTHPWLILWPFDQSGSFVGFQGMSFHGGLAGVLVATFAWCKVHRQNWLDWADIIALSAPLGYTFGRLGNFINGELWGKLTLAPWGMVFPYADKYNASESWVQDFATRAGIVLHSLNDKVNLPRHPSQLYEALFEGVVLWLILWLLVRKRRPFKGFAGGVYLVGYGFARFVIEYFRQPDEALGYIVALGDPAAPTDRFGGLLNFSMGQLLSLFMVIGGIAFILAMKKRNERSVAASRLEASKPSARKLRKKLRQ
jgi:phosphatidylglycerol---prolipoprotein diacylglyceryl transferase